MEEWKDYYLNEICDYATERISAAQSNIEKYISTENMLPDKGGITIASSLPSSGTVVSFKTGDILISNIRPYFKKIWKATFDGQCSPDVLCFKKKDFVDGGFLYYLLSQQLFFDHVMAGTNGCKMPRGDKKQIMNFELSLPPLPLQRRISSLLSSLDAKIETNRRINACLEEMAQALFRSWFIDFTPFKQQEFVEDEFGRRPKGWKVGTAESFFKINIGKTPPRKETQWFSTKDEDVKWVSISDMGKIATFISDSSEKLTKEAVDRFNVIIVPKNTILLSFKLTIGRVAITTTDLTTNEAIARFYLNNLNEREYLYLYLQQYDYNRLGSTSSIATAVNSKIIKEMPIVLPSSEALRDFSTIAKPIFDTIETRAQESSRLATLRDTLLPKLMSGELIPEEITA